MSDFCFLRRRWADAHQDEKSQKRLKGTLAGNRASAPLNLYNEPETIAAMHDYAEKNGYAVDITDTRYHHEIYLSDPRRTAPDRLKTVVRHPVKRI